MFSTLEEARRAQTISKSAHSWEVNAPGAAYRPEVLLEEYKGALGIRSIQSLVYSLKSNILNTIGADWLT